jgi:hypothetical protein
VNPRVSTVTTLDGYRLRIIFTNGERRIFDATPYIGYPAFKRLANPGYFALARTDHGTVSWPDDIDFCPDTLYVDSVCEEPEIYE